VPAAGAVPGGFPMKIEFFRDRILGADTPVPPVMIGAAAPDGAPPRRIRDDKHV